MARNERAAQLPSIWLLSDVVWVVIGYVTTRATEQAEDYNCEPLVHFVILSNTESASIEPADAASFDFK
jgi:hypothetical protein